MKYPNVKSFTSAVKSKPLKGPIAFIFAEDDVELESTIAHHLKLRFKQVVVIGDELVSVPDHMSDQVIHITSALPANGEIHHLMNQMIKAIPDQWMYYCYNAEYLHFPFCETRSVGEMIGFNVEERRDTIMTYVVDLYAGDLNERPDAIDLENVYLDKSGYYALTRKDAWNNDLDRQMDFFGGLRWRFEEHIPAKKRRIDRVSIFKSKPDLTLNADFTFSDPEYNTISCQWHHSISAAVCSFRTAKALKRNPGSTFDISTFWWHNSQKFDWNSQQLMDLGLMEPGQWF
ncbi:MAG: glycosyltransferase family 2 protein [Planktomarina sp.]